MEEGPVPKTMESFLRRRWKYYIISQGENEVIANDDASDDSTKSLQRKKLVIESVSGDLALASYIYPACIPFRQSMPG